MAAPIKDDLPTPYGRHSVAPSTISVLNFSTGVVDRSIAF